MKRLSVVLLLGLFVLGGCATTGGVPQMTPAQQDALCRLAGNGLAETMNLVKPEFAPQAKVFCQLFKQATTAVAAQSVLESGLTFLSNKYTPDDKLGKVVMNALEIIGYNEGQIQTMIFKKTDAAVKLQGFTQDMWRKANLVVEGFCQVI